MVRTNIILIRRTLTLNIVLWILSISAVFAAAARESLDSLAQQGRFQEIIDTCSLSIKTNPQDACAYCMRGWAKSHLPQYRRGLDDLNEALRLRPNYLRAYKYRALEFYATGQFQKSLDDLNSAIELEPRSEQELYYLRSWLYCSSFHDGKHALNDLNHVIDSNRKDASAYVQRGWLYEKMNEPQRGIEDYNRALTLEPNDAYAHLDRAQVYAGLKEYKKAMEDINRAAELIPRERSAFVNRAWLLWCMGLKQQAVKDMQLAQLVKCTESISYFDFTSMYQVLGAIRRSDNDLDKEITVLPFDWVSRLNRAIAREHRGNYQGAIDDLNIVIKLNGQLEEAYLHRAAMRLKCNQHAGAVCDYAMAAILSLRSNLLILAILIASTFLLYKLLQAQRRRNTSSIKPSNRS